MNELNLFLSKQAIIITKDEKYLCALDRSKLQEITVKDFTNLERIPFLFILGLYKYEIINNEKYYFLVLVTKAEKCNFFNVHQIKSFKIIPLTENVQNSNIQRYIELLKLGLNHCPMYFSDDYNLTLTFPQQFENHQTRRFFVWNSESINCLHQIWPKAQYYKEVVSGYIQKSGPFINITRKSNRNGGCHSWNRGCDLNGNSANFLENEEIMIINDEFNTIEKVSGISHIELSGSCPLFWTVYPTMQLNRSFHFGPAEESERRFNLHFDNLLKHYSPTKKEHKKSHHHEKNLVIVSLLNKAGKERELNSRYKEMAKKRGIRFHHIKFNHLVKKKGELNMKIEDLKNYFDASIINNGKIEQVQTKFLRINCSSCLDRTSVFMEIMFRKIFEKFDEKFFNENIKFHKNLWNLRANKISKEYALTRGLKTYLIDNDCKTFKGKIVDNVILLQRFFCGIFCEGKFCDAYNAVLQEKKFVEFDNISIFYRFILFIQLFILFVFFFLIKDRDYASKVWKQRIKTIIDHPHISDLRDADEFDDIDFSHK